VTRHHATSALRKILDAGVSLAVSFNDKARSGSGQANTESLGSGRTSTAGRVSAVGLHPHTPERTFEALKQMLKAGKIALAHGVSLDSVKHALHKPENKGLGVINAVAKLTKKEKLLKPALKAVYKLKALTPELH